MITEREEMLQRGRQVFDGRLDSYTAEQREKILNVLDQHGNMESFLIFLSEWHIAPEMKTEELRAIYYRGGLRAALLAVGFTEGQRREALLKLGPWLDPSKK